MKDERKTKKMLIEELHALRGRVADLENADIGAEHAGKAETAQVMADIERYRTTFDMAPAAIAQIDIDGSFLRINPFWQEWLGYSEDELLAMKVADVTHPDDGTEDRRVFRELLKGNVSTLEREKRYIKKDGGVVWGSVRSAMHCSASGEPEYLIAVTQDITDRKQSEVALREREARISKILRTAPVGVGMARNRLFTGVSDRLCHMLGYERDELIGQPTRACFASEWDYEQIGRLYRLSKRSDNPTVEIQLRRSDGSTIDVIGSLSILDHDDPDSEVIFAVIDNTESKRAERALRKSEEKFSKAFRSSPDSVTLVQLETGKILEINDGFLRVFGYTRAEAIGRTILELGLWRNPEDREHMVAEFQEHGRVHDMEEVFLT